MFDWVKKTFGVLEVHCDKCNKPITGHSAEIFAPADEHRRCKRFEICPDCYKSIEKQMRFNKK
jgi:uncharacterized protein with PIN domain